MVVIAWELQKSTGAFAMNVTLEKIARVSCCSSSSTYWNGPFQGVNGSIEASALGGGRCMLFLKQLIKQH